MRSAESWFALYGESHQNSTNKLIHWVCIPVIALTTLGVLQAVSLRLGLGTIGLQHGLLLVAMAFYATLSWRHLVGMALLSALGLVINQQIVAAGLPLGALSAAGWGLAWLAQFVGHKIEGKKPSFFQDLQFLLVGPAWLLDDLLRRSGLAPAR